jgi:hypothetical protein
LQRPGVMRTCSKNKRIFIGALAIFISRGA